MHTSEALFPQHAQIRGIALRQHLSVRLRGDTGMACDMALVVASAP